MRRNVRVCAANVVALGRTIARDILVCAAMLFRLRRNIELIELRRNTAPPFRYCALRRFHPLVLHLACLRSKKQNKKSITLKYLLYVAVTTGWIPWSG